MFLRTPHIIFVRSGRKSHDRTGVPNILSSAGSSLIRRSGRVLPRSSTELMLQVSPSAAFFAALTGRPENHHIRQRTQSLHRGTPRETTCPINQPVHLASSSFRGTGPRQMPGTTQRVVSLTPPETSSAMIGKSSKGVHDPTITPSTFALVAEAPITALGGALRCSHTVTPARLLIASGPRAPIPKPCRRINTWLPCFHATFIADLRAS